MRIPLSWLREMTPVAIDPSELSAVLANLGLVVDGMERVGGGLEAIVVAEVLQIAPIEGADRIRHVTVDAGDRQLGIVCGAWNFSVGDRVPLAPVGAVLPGGLEIGRRKMRGVASEGMLCSGRELGLSDDGGGLLVLGSASAGGGAAPGTPLVDALGIVPDIVFDLDVAPNRPDCLCVAGVARDVAAALHLPFELPSPEVPTSGEPASAFATVAVEAPAMCTRLTGRVLTGVSVVPSPPEIARRLLLCGMRPIDAVVDSSNYVMLELGQPTHPYDLGRVGGGLVARAARAGEWLTTLDGVERQLAATDCVIADPGGRTIGLAGVMGGGATEIGPTTTRVLLEAAHFDPLTIARTARRVGLRSEASVRFERGCDPEMPPLAGVRYAELLREASVAAGAEPPVLAPGLLDAWPAGPRPTRLTVRTARVNALLGTHLDVAAVRGYLEPIGFDVESPEQGVLAVRVPSYRPDVTRETDVVEEVARHHGYERIPSRDRRAPGVGALDAHQRRRRELRRALLALGAHEAWTSSFSSPEDLARAGVAGGEVRVTNPMAAEESVLRTSLRPGLLAALARNAARRSPSLRLFEIGHVFATPAGAVLPEEEEVVAVAFGRGEEGAEEAVRGWRLLADALALDGIGLAAAEAAGLHPTRTARLVSDEGAVLGLVGEVDPDVLAAFELPQRRVGWIELSAVPLLALAGARRAAAEPSRYPSADVDLAFSVEESVPADAVEACLREAAGELCESLQLFDVYRGPGVEEGFRSLAYRLRLCAPDRTLTDAEIAAARAECVSAVERSLPARLRG